jgi:hypothetical protein
MKKRLVYSSKAIGGWRRGWCAVVRLFGVEKEDGMQ